MNFQQFLLKYPDVDYLLRILLALFLGFAIGFERKSRAKEAGIRTHTLVAVGAALYTIISKYGFAEADTARVAAQIVAGVGFLGAGMIMHQRQVIHGLTTAAGIWATAGIGMAAAAGLYVVAIASTLFIILVQVLLHTNLKFFRMKRYFTYRIVFYEEETAHQTLFKIFNVDKFARLKTEKKDGRLYSTAMVKTDMELPSSTLIQILKENEFVVSCESYSDDTE